MIRDFQKSLYQQQKKSREFRKSHDKEKQSLKIHPKSYLKLSSKVFDVFHILTCGYKSHNLANV